MLGLRAAVSAAIASAGIGEGQVMGKRRFHHYRYAICLIVSALILVPIITTVLGGLKTNAELLSHPFSIPLHPRIENYKVILFSNDFWIELRNSTVVMILTAIGVLVLSSLPAFVLSRISFWGRSAVLLFFSLGLLFPLAVAILPLYIVLRQSHLIDSLYGVILPQIAFGLPSNIIILRGFFVGIPRELEEAAFIDGVGYGGFFLRILLPLMRPSLAAVFALTMVTSWNSFFLPLLVLNSQQLYTLPLGIMQFQGQHITDWAMVLAFVTLSLIPTIAFYLLAQRYIVSGLTAGAVKG